MGFLKSCWHRRAAAAQATGTGVFWLFCTLTQAQTASHQVPPHIVITDFKVLNQTLPLDSLLKLNQVQLPNEQNTFSISYSLSSTLQHDTIIYYHKLEGADPDWIRTPLPQTVNYILLPPGSYTFLVKAESRNKLFQTAITRVPIVIRIPFWLTGWFILGCCCLFSGIIYYLHRQSINRILAIEALRQKVARDLHDDMGSVLSTINILSLMAKDKLRDDPLKVSEYLTKISDNSTRMMETMDDIVWSINPANDNMDKVIARMRAFATEVLEAQNADLRFTIAPEVEHVNLNMEQRQDLFLIFKEVVNNAAKYAGPTQVLISLVLLKDSLQLSVQDNGIGFIVDEADSGNGLNNMRKRTLQLGGEIHIQSKPGSGTTIQLKIPVH